METQTQRAPRTKLAKKVRRGEWITFGPLVWRVDDIVTDEAAGTVCLLLGYTYTEVSMNSRLVMHDGR